MRLLALVCLLTICAATAAAGTSASTSVVTVEGVLVSWETFTAKTVSGEIVDRSGTPRLFVAPLFTNVHAQDAGRVVRLRGRYTTDASGAATLHSTIPATPLERTKQLVIRHGATAYVGDGRLDVATRTANVVMLHYPATLEARLRAAKTLTHTYRFALRTGSWTLISFS